MRRQKKINKYKKVLNVSDNYYQREIETMPREELKKLQSERLVRQVRHVWEHVPYYRGLMEKKGVTPDDIRSIDDLHKLPFISKEDLRLQYPYGLLGTDLKNCVRIHSTSGTTGRRVVAFYTQEDIDIWDDCCARAIVAAGGTDGDVCQIAYGFGLFTGGAGLNGGSHKVGCLTLPMSSGNTDRQIQFMMDLKATMLCCTPSYAAFIGESLKERGYRPEDNSLKAGIFGAEPWTEEMRRGIEEALGIKAYDIYGLTETSGPGVAFECKEQSGMHINEDHFAAEIIDPDTGEVLPMGATGELVLTSLDKEAFPLLRYRTRDITKLSVEPCSCGRTFVKMKKPMGRSDDMMIIRGVNVFPSQIETVLLNEGYAPNYQIVVGRENNTDTLDVYVEMSEGTFSDVVKDMERETAKLAQAMKTMLGISAKVHLVAPKSIARSEGKAVRVIDNRKLHD
ncbi:MAG: phenylacetate--CoA ligase [Clostridia bacterium]|nr:phenylacetate--CoA ligase [Clostridia bacterium]